MHRSGMRSSSLAAGGVAVLRPPKPPCWRDFVVQDPRRYYAHAYPPADLKSSPSGEHLQGVGSSTGADPLDVLGVSGSRLHPHYGATGGGGGGGGGGSARTSKTGKRLRARIHRTRSEHLIQVEDLPEGDLTVTLAETRPHELRLGVRPAAELDERLYAEENNRRCQTWLASIEAAEPLDDIGYTYTKSKKDDQAALEDVDVEVPEETFSWDDDEDDEEEEDDDEEDNEEEEEEAGQPEMVDLRPPFNTSASSSESDGLLQRVMAAAAVAAAAAASGASYVVSCDENKGQRACDQTSRKSAGRNERGRGGLRATSSSRDVHGRLSSKRILSIPEHPSID